MSTNHISGARLTASLFAAAAQRRALLSSSSQRNKQSEGDKVKSIDESGSKKIGHPSIGEYLKTFMRQWKKDLAAIEKRSKARRKRPKTPASKGKGRKDTGPHFDSYLKLENTKAAEAWNMARENLASKRDIERFRLERSKSKPGKDVGDSVQNRGTFDEFLDERRNLPSSPNVSPRPKLTATEMDESDEELDRFRQSYRLPEPPSRGTPVSESLWAKKFEKARSKRERIYEKLRNKYKNNQADQIRLMKLKAFLNKQELDQLDKLRREYQKKIAREEMRQRESARILKVIKKIHDQKNE